MKLILSTEQEKRKQETAFKGQTELQKNTAEGSARQQQDPKNEHQQSKYLHLVS